MRKTFKPQFTITNRITTGLPRIERARCWCAELLLVRGEGTILHLILGNNSGIIHFFRRADKLVSK